MMDELIVCLMILGGLFLILFVCGILADYVLPHIPAVERFLDTLPDWDDEEG